LIDGCYRFRKRIRKVNAHARNVVHHTFVDFRMRRTGGLVAFNPPQARLGIGLVTIKTMVEQLLAVLYFGRAEQGDL
jgi:hypothetical protein